MDGLEESKGRWARHLSLELKLFSVDSLSSGMHGSEMAPRSKVRPPICAAF